MVVHRGDGAVLAPLAGQQRQQLAVRPQVVREDDGEVGVGARDALQRALGLAQHVLLRHALVQQVRVAAHEDVDVVRDDGARDDARQCGGDAVDAAVDRRQRHEHRLPAEDLRREAPRPPAGARAVLLQQRRHGGVARRRGRRCRRGQAGHVFPQQRREACTARSVGAAGRCRQKHQEEQEQEHHNGLVGASIPCHAVEVWAASKFWRQFGRRRRASRPTEVAPVSFPDPTGIARHPNGSVRALRLDCHGRKEEEGRWRRREEEEGWWRGEARSRSVADGPAPSAAPVAAGVRGAKRCGEFGRAYVDAVGGALQLLGPPGGLRRQRLDAGAHCVPQERPGHVAEIAGVPGACASCARVSRPCVAHALRRLPQIIDVNQRELRGMGGYAALHVACAGGSAEAVRILVQHGADVHLQADSAGGERPLHVCCSHGQVPTTVRVCSLPSSPHLTSPHPHPGLNAGGLRSRIARGGGAAGPARQLRPQRLVLGRAGSTHCDLRASPMTHAHASRPFPHIATASGGSPTSSRTWTCLRVKPSLRRYVPMSHFLSLSLCSFRSRHSPSTRGGWGRNFSPSCWKRPAASF